jgi:microcystin-dependent protein
MDVYIGMIFLFAGNFAPTNFVFCDGRLLPIAQFSALFSLLGTTYGGDGVRTFALPDLRGRTVFGAGQGPGRSNYTLGQVGGVETVSLSIQNLPAHTHSLNGDNTAGGKEFPGPNHVIGASATDKMYSGNPPNATMNPKSIGTTGSNVPVEIINPYQAINYIIATQGLFPSRN